MALNGNLDGVTGNSKPKYANTSSVYGVSVTEAANTLGDGNKVAHAGWVRQTVGTGPVTALAITDPGEGYSNGFITFTGGGGTGANASFIVNEDGNVTSVIINSGGSGYTSAPTAIVPGANTEVATVVATVGGRAGRRHYETLVAMGSIVGDNAADNTFFPGT
jgi:hypothetical protein